MKHPQARQPLQHFTIDAIVLGAVVGTSAETRPACLSPGKEQNLSVLLLGTAQRLPVAEAM
jgi:hypothetical protein